MKDSPRLSFLESFQGKLKLDFSDLSLLEAALTHRSFINESQEERAIHNERLEFLGDAVLGQTIARLLYLRLSDASEGELSRLKSLLVSEPTLAEAAAELGLPEALRLGKGEELSGGRKKRAIAADALEALIGAIYLDRGAGAAEAFIGACLGPSLERALMGPAKDYKTLAQEYAQSYSASLPLYKLEGSEGPDHERIFRVSCSLDGLKTGPCPGRTKKAAEQAAAKALIDLLKLNGVAAARLAELGGA